MNLDKDDIEIDEILHRYFRKELSIDEMAELEAWRDASAENRQIFDEARILFLDLKGLAFYQNVARGQAESSWKDFKEKNNIELRQPTKSFTFLKYAASVLIIFSVATGIYYYQDRSKEVMLASVDALQEVTTPDGSVISLNAGATLAYVTPFQNNERRVRLDGEAFFDVTSFKEKPFVVEVGDAQVRVLGTKFFINRPRPNEISVQVEEGKVLLSYDSIHQIVEASEELTLDLQTALTVNQRDDSGLNTFWKYRRLVFNLTSLEEVIRTVNDAYDASLQLEGSSDSCSLTVTFEDEELENVVEVIASTLNYQVVEKEGALVLSGDGCQ